MSPVLKLLCELIALPSVNPAFSSSDLSQTGEKRVAEFLAAHAAAAGLAVELKEALPGRFNVLAVLEPVRKARRRILLAPHMDTVGAESDDLYCPAVRQGRLYGRGACDTKGSVAAMMSALIQLAGEAQRPQETEIVFAGLIDEENAQAGSRALAASRFKADLAIVGEPTCLKIITAHKGTIWLRLETRGKAAHGAKPELGVNAVHEMARIIDWIETAYAGLLRKRRHALVGHATINVGMVRGGSQPNIVPPHCQAVADRRTIPGELDASVMAELRALLRKNGFKASVGCGKDAPCLPMEADARLPLIRQFMSVVGQASPVGVDYFCDASVLSKAGIPSVVFGPGDIAQAHTAYEWISIKSLETATAMLVAYLRSLP
jgi:acetylornithine deacetylase/succinyl-diaminopimelate desuccinylase-like protein